MMKSWIFSSCLVFWSFAVSCCNGFLIPNSPPSALVRKTAATVVTEHKRALVGNRSNNKVLSATSGKNNGSLKKALTLPKIAELVQLTFMQACLQLSEDRGEVDLLKLFIVAVRSAYLEGKEPKQLIDALEALGKPMPQEVLLLRNTWIQVIYLVLSTIDDTPPMELDAEIADRYKKIVPIVIELRQQKMSSSSSSARHYAGKELLDLTRDCFDLSDPFKQAAAIQSLQVAWNTLAVLDEVEQSEGELAEVDP